MYGMIGGMDMKKMWIWCSVLCAILWAVTGCAVQNETVDSQIIRVETENQDLNGQGSESVIRSTNVDTSKSLVFIQSEMSKLYSESGYGFYNDIIRQSFSKYNIDVTFDSADADQIEMELGKDIYFGLPGCSQNISKYENSLFTNNFYASPYKIYYLKTDDPLGGNYTHIESLLGLKLGVNPGCDPFKNVEYSDLTTTAVHSYIEGIEALKSGEIDLLIYDVLAESQVDDLAIGSYETPYAMRYHAIRVWSDYPDADKLIDLFDKGLKELIDNGTYNELLTSYDMESPPESLFNIQYDRKPIEIGYPEFPPYEYTNEDGRPVGICIETVKEALALGGFGLDDYVLKPIPWERLMDMGFNGEVDMIIEGLKTEERAEYLHFSNVSIFMLDFDMAVRNDSQLVYDGNRFNRDIEYIGGVRGYDYGESIYKKLDTLGLDVKIEPSSSDLVESFSNNRYEIILEDENVVKYYLGEVGMADYTIHELNANGHDSYLFYPKKRDVLWLRDLVDKGIERLKYDGGYNYIVKDYFESR